MAAGRSIDHFVVLVLENRSFDHLLGFYRDKPGMDVLIGTEDNPDNPYPAPGSPPPNRYPVTPTATDMTPTADPGHTLRSTNLQMYGRWEPTFPDDGKNNGFVYDYAPRHPRDPGEIMRCFAPTAPEIANLTTLVKAYHVCDRWFASVPAPTWPNRLFVHAATSDGHVGNDVCWYTMPTIYDRLDARFNGADDTWAIYYHDIPQSLILWSMFLQYVLPSFTNRFRLFGGFGRDVRRKRLPRYTFIEPQYFSWAISNTQVDEANDQHPGHRVSLGDSLIGEVYTALRDSAYYRDRTMLIITWDEHGGTYDHRFPTDRVPRPDDQTSFPDLFDFTRLGLRVPALVVAAGIDPRPDHCMRDHTTILATVEKRFDLEPLTKRDAWAQASDCDLRTLLGRPARRVPVGAMRVRDRPRTDRTEVMRVRTLPPSEFQSSLVDLARRLDIPGETLRARDVRRHALVATEDDGARFVRRTMADVRQAATTARVRRPR
jgi:phospholipase C